jgi:class 3 adenylate cyclase/predicted ATPase
MERKLAAILAADVVGYSRLMEVDEKGTHDALKALWSEVLDPSVAAHRGRTVKRMGDGLLVEFASIVDAVDCAVAIQCSVQAHQAETALERRVALRIGVNLGDVIVEEGDLFGDGVNLAARLEALARPGGICIAAKVRDEIRGKVDAVFQDLGETEVKNLSYPVHIFEHVIGREPGERSRLANDDQDVPGLRLKLLGPFEAHDASGNQIAIPGRKTELLLAILAKAGRRGMPREKLIGLLWSDRGEEQARASLRQALWALRRALEGCEPPPLRTEESLVALDPRSVKSDVMVFERLADENDPQSLEEAVSLYGGEFLEGMVARDPAGEDWLFYERERLSGLARGVHLRLLDHLIQSGRGSRALEVGQRLLTFDPLEEEAHRALMRLYRAQGQRTLALQQYEICAKVLRRELGIRPDEQTRALRDEIEGGRQLPHVSAGDLRASAEPKPTAAAPHMVVAELRGERKQASVLAVDFLDTDLSDLEADPEDQAERQQDDIVTITATIKRYGGEVKLLPDGGLVAIFGAPIAFEDHALRACIAGLELSRQADGPATRRFGINSGEVVIRPSEDGAFGGFDTFGPTIPLAIRIKDLATPSRIAISESTHHQTAGAILADNRRALTVPGLTRPLDVWDLEDVPDPSARFRAARRRGLTPFVGREEDSYLIRQAARRAARGSGRAVALVGEPGVGKSRLVHEFVGAIAEGEWQVLETGVGSFSKAMPYGPVLELLRSIFGVSDSEQRSRLVEHLRGQILALGEDLEALVAPLSAVFDLPVEDFFWRELSAEEKHERILDAAVALLQRLSDRKKLVLVIEDLHWIDEHSKAFIGRLLDGIAAVPIFALFNFRPEFSHDWAGRSLFTQISIQPLEDEDASELAQVLLGSDTSVAVLKSSLIARTRGMPFFLEESVHSLLETGFLEGEVGALRLVKGSVDDAVAAVPPTVQSVLAARIDRLSPEAKRLLQSAAVIGKDFSKQLLSASVKTDDDDKLQRGLEELQAAEFIHEIRKLPEPEYTFKHALTQDVAYASLLKNERRESHCLIAEALKRDFPARCEDSPEVLAHHLTEAGETAEAIDRWLEAGEKAVRRVAHSEACAHFERGLALLHGLDDDPARLAKEAALRIGYGVPQMNTLGAIAKETMENYERAAEVCGAIGDNKRLFAAYFGQWIVSHLRDDLRGMDQAAVHLVRIAESSDDEGMTLEAHHSRWAGRFLAGDFIGALEHADLGLAIYRPEAHHVLTYEYAGHDPGGCGHNLSSVSYWLLGDTRKAEKHARESLALALELGHRTTLLESFFMGLVLSTMTRDVLRIEAAATGEAYPSLEEMSQDALDLYLEGTIGIRGWVAFHLGDKTQGLETLRDNIGPWLEGTTAWTMTFLTLGAEALGEAGAAGEALEVMDKLLAKMESHGMCWYEAEAHRVRAETLLRLDADNLDEAVIALERSLAISRRQQAKALELRAATSLARLCADQGRETDAKDLLVPILGAFQPGTESLDLKAAERLLEGLA